MDDYRRGYTKGYTARGTASWPEYAPPSPPDEKVRKLFDAAKELNDAAASVLQTVIPDEEIFKLLQEKQRAMDAAFVEITNWLLLK